MNVTTLKRRMKALEARRRAETGEEEFIWRDVHEIAERCRKKLGLSSAPFILPSESPPRNAEQWEVVRKETYRKLGLPLDT